MVEMWRRSLTGQLGCVHHNSTLRLIASFKQWSLTSLTHYGRRTKAGLILHDKVEEKRKNAATKELVVSMEELPDSEGSQPNKRARVDDGVSKQEENNVEESTPEDLDDDNNNN